MKATIMNVDYIAFSFCSEIADQVGVQWEIAMKTFGSAQFVAFDDFFEEFEVHDD